MTSPAKQWIVSVLFLSLGFAGVCSVPATHAETPPVEKAFENVKTSLETLVGGKDKATTSDELGLRVETFLQVLTLSAAETNDLILKLTAIENPLDDTRGNGWKKAALATLSEANDRYATETERIATERKTLTLDRVKEFADWFKEWREKEYLGTAGQIRELVMILQGAGTLDLAGMRLSKVTEDVEKIANARIRGADALPPLLTQAKKSITEGKKLNEAAADLFKKNYFPAWESTSTASSTDDTGDTATSSAPDTVPPSELSPTSTESSSIDTRTSSSTAHSTVSKSATSTSAVSPSPSIRDLVRESLMKTRDAYRIFIGMSNVVRALLD
jgi:hypothetical protein